MAALGYVVPPLVTVIVGAILYSALYYFRGHFVSELADLRRAGWYVLEAANYLIMLIAGLVGVYVTFVVGDPRSSVGFVVLGLAIAMAFIMNFFILYRWPK